MSTVNWSGGTKTFAPNRGNCYANRYNQSVRSILPLLTLLAIVGCSRDIRNENAIRQGVIDYLANRAGLNVSAMNVNLTSVVYRKDEADATVSFSAKGSAPAGGMSMRYVLERKGDRWVVKGRADSGANPHGQPGGTNPHGGGMPVPGGADSSGAMPPGHPAVPPPDSGRQ